MASRRRLLLVASGCGLLAMAVLAVCWWHLTLDSDYYLSKGIAYGHEGDYASAVLCYTRAIELDPKNAAACHNRGLCLKHDDHERAIADLSKAIELFRENGDVEKLATAHYSRGLVYDRTLEPDYDRALADFTKAIELRPDYAWAYVCRAHTHARRGAHQEAKDNYRRAVELDPDGDAGKEARRQLEELDVTPP